MLRVTTTFFAALFSISSGVKVRSVSDSSLAARREAFCQHFLMLTLETCVQPYTDNTTMVITGDIKAMWLRDSAAQLNPYIALAKAEGPSSPFLSLLEGAVRSQAQFILTDPYANAFTRDWESAHDERLARGGYVFTGNYELDSGVYFLRFLANLALAMPDDVVVVKEKPVHEATRMLVALFRQEQQHANNRSSYRYPKWEPWEMPGADGQGNPVGYTGMVWSAFRPSDDAQKYGYHIPSNIFLASTLKHVINFARDFWDDPELASQAEKLRADIQEGVQRFGTTKRNDGQEVYCYEVDGLGQCNLMDDANVPSLLSLPYLDPDGSCYDGEIYRSTREFVLSSENPWFFDGPAGKGVGSPHTGANTIWPLAMVMQAMTAPTDQEHKAVLQSLLQPPLSDGLPESFSKDDIDQVTRHWFGWPNALMAEHLLSKGLCQAQTAPAVFPKARAPPLDGPLLNSKADFYHTDPALLRRSGVTLPVM